MVWEMNLFFKGEEGLQTPRLVGVLAHASLLESHLLDLRLRATIFGAHSAQVEVVVPDIARSTVCTQPRDFSKGVTVPTAQMRIKPRWTRYRWCA